MKNKISEYLTIPEIQDIYKTCNRTTSRGLRDYCIISLMLHTGLRRSEVVSLPKKALQDQKSGEVLLYAVTKGKKQRIISIQNPELLGSLKRYLEKTSTYGDSNAPFFWSIPKGPTKERHPITNETIRLVIKKAVKLAGITKRITPHSLRHTFITQSLITGSDIETLRVLAGHSSSFTTSRYTHTCEERMKQAIEKLPY